MQWSSESYKLIGLTKGKVALVDASDYDMLRTCGWYAKSIRDDVIVAYNNNVGSMHQLIMCHSGINHRNANCLDNRRCNLRPATQAQMMRARRPHPGPFKGVRIVGNLCEAFFGDEILGYFSTPSEAARCYDDYVSGFGDEFMYLNFPKFDFPSYEDVVERLLNEVLNV